MTLSLYSLGVIFSIFLKIWVKWEKLVYPTSSATMLTGRLLVASRSFAKVILQSTM